MAIEQESVQVSAKKILRCWRLEGFFEFDSERGSDSYLFRLHFEDLLMAEDGAVLSRSRPDPVVITYKEMQQRYSELLKQLAAVLDKLNAERINSTTNTEVQGEVKQENN